MKYIYLLLALILSQGSGYVFGQAVKADWQSIDARPLPAWYQDAKFGIFIHWGVYSVPSYRPVGTKRFATYAEWYESDVYGDPSLKSSFHDRVYGRGFEYRDFAPFFKAELFDAGQWAELLKRSGARYVVLTAKHHDGFCLWPTRSPYSKNWNSMQVGPKRDLVGEITRAVRSRGLKMGLYYSLMEFESTPTKNKASGYYIPTNLVDKYRIPSDEYVEKHMKVHFKELVDNYQPALLFADGEWDYDEDYWQSKQLLSWLYNSAANKDEVIVNDRWGKTTRGKHGGYYTTEYSYKEDAVGSEHPWEENRGMGQSYGFNRAENIDDYNSSKALIDMLVEVVSRGGNFLLNIGPAADGTIPVIMQQRLVDIGNWLSVNGEAIYGSSAWEAAPDSQDVVFTKKGKDLYVLVKKWQPRIELQNIATPTKVTLLGCQAAIQTQTKSRGLSILAPKIWPTDLKGEHVWVYKLENAF